MAGARDDGTSATSRDGRVDVERISRELLARVAGTSGSAERYRLKGEVGRGAGGAVLRVLDRGLRRDVAMKVLHDERAEDGSSSNEHALALGRFLDEAQVTAQLEHPGIVPVHELGIDADGCAYFTMRLVRGRSLADVLALVHAGRDGWTVTRALGVLLKVCEAVAFAHARGVIHRDLKPSNVMVGSFGEVYVVDWGVARVLGRSERVLDSVRTDRRDATDSGLLPSLATLTGDVVGTPGYMSPEQARGVVDELGPATDVYAVGAILYELLAGRPPHARPDGGRPSLRDVLSGDVEPLARAAPHAPAELVAICEKAMAGEAGARYPDLGAAADDLRAYLENRVVRAHRTGALVELRKWVRRNRAAALASAAALLALLGGLGTSSGLYVEAREQAERAGREARTRAQVLDVLTGLFEAQDPARAQGATLTVKELLDREARALGVDGVDDPDVRADVLATMARLYVALGLYEDAEPLLERALAVRAAQAEAQREPDAAAVARARAELGAVRVSLARYEDAEPLLVASLAELRALDEEDPAELDVLSNLAQLELLRGGYERSIELAREALALSRRALGDEHPDTLVRMNNLAGAYLSLGRLDEARPLFAEAYRAMSARAPAHPDTLKCLNNLALVERRSGRLDAAEELYAALLEAQRDVHGDAHPDTLAARHNVASLSFARSRFEEALDAFRAVAAGRREALGPDHPDTLGALGHVALVLTQLERYDEAEPLYRDVLAGLRALVGPRHVAVLDVQRNYADMLVAGGRHAEAEPQYRDTVEGYGATLGAEHPTTLRRRADLAGVLAELGAQDEAIGHARAAVAGLAAEDGYARAAAALLARLGAAPP